jgi:hypothetical protein
LGRLRGASGARVKMRQDKPARDSSAGGCFA